MTLTLDHIRMTFDGHEVLRDVTVHVDDGRFVSLIGRSGCGTTSRSDCPGGAPNDASWHWMPWHGWD